MSGDKTGGFTIFYADDGLDTGPILLQKETTIDLNDTVDTFYNRFLYPEGKFILLKSKPELRSSLRSEHKLALAKPPLTGPAGERKNTRYSPNIRYINLITDLPEDEFFHIHAHNGYPQE